jgi:pimeloyl-ACP methyl ester carboxylesterase
MSPIQPSLPAAAAPFLTGHLFPYARNRVAFESFPSSLESTTTTGDSVQIPNKCILLGGLSDGLWPVPYTTQLLDALPTNNWSLIQPILSSSYTGFGHSGGLDTDVAELDELLDYLKLHRHCSNAALVGHSTGCQIIVHYLKHGRNTDLISMAALQAPVSDRESATICHDLDPNSPDRNAQLQQQHIERQASFLQRAKEMKSQNALDEMMPRNAFWAPITARRFLDLFEVGGTDDYFSFDFTNAELHQRLHHVGRVASPTLQRRRPRRVLVACSGSDEYVPAFVDSQQLLTRLCDAMNGKFDPLLEKAASLSNENEANATRSVVTAIPLYLPTANHNLSSNDGADAALFIQTIGQLLLEVADSKQDDTC